MPKLGPVPALNELFRADWDVYGPLLPIEVAAICSCATRIASLTCTMCLIRVLVILASCVAAIRLILLLMLILMMLMRW